MKQMLKKTIIAKRDLKKITSLLPSKEPVLKGKTITPVCEPDISGNEERYLSQAIRSSWISATGEFVNRFETAFRKTVSKTRYAIATNSGTTALHTAVTACGIGPGDEVIVPAFTMIATANAVSYTHAKIVLVDADPNTWNIDVKQLETAMTKKTKAILPVHIYGVPCAMDEINRIAKTHHCWVIEDAAESHGATYKGKPVGSLGDMGCFSLYANKSMTTGEGGMVTTSNALLAECSRSLVNSAFSTERHFWHSMIGFSYRMTNLQAAVGVAQVERFAAFLKKKRQIASWYRQLLSGIPGIRFQTIPSDSISSYWMNGILVDKKAFGRNKNQLRGILADNGIETRSFFIPMHLQPVYYHQFKGKRFPVSEMLCRDGFYLPSSVRLTRKDIERIALMVKAGRR